MSDASDDQPGILIVEADILVRHPLAEYLRECGYRVVEAATGDEARQLLDDPKIMVDIVLADVNMPGDGGFALANWVRENQPEIEVILAGTTAKAAEKCGELCERGPELAKPYDHSLVLDRIRRLIAARQRGKPGKR